MQPEDLNLPCLGIDSHAHLDLKQFSRDLDKVLEHADKAGVQRIGNVFLNYKAYLRGRELFKDQEQVFFLLGVHPHEAHLAGEEQLQSIRRAFSQDKRLRALGEIGLDFYRLRQEKDIQIKAFQDQLALAKEMDLPVVIHCRDAEQETLAILQDMGLGQRPLLWHCFGRDRHLAQEIISQGWHISVPGIVTFQQTKSLQDAVTAIPTQRLLLETDCPFLAPEPCRGQRNEPAFLAFTASRVAELKGLTSELIWERSAANSREFFSLQEEERVPGD
ncbi:MAG: TatD family hydrolase [Thermodesulfobacteriota bacterium]